VLEAGAVAVIERPDSAVRSFLTNLTIAPQPLAGAA